MAAILHICLEGSLKNHFIGRGNFSDAMVNHYLSILLYHGLLESSKDTNSRTYYTTSDKGRRFIGGYLEIQALFRKGPAADSRSPDDATSKPASSSPSSGGNRILVVDDEPDITSAVKIGLEDNGFAVNVFNDPTSALKAYRPGVYDLLLLDVKMPKMSGFELYREIRKVDEEAKVCFLTAFEMYIEEFRRVFPSMDVRHFIQKPITMGDLVDQIRKMTGK
jgi:CheY-like chemotaxis protein/predicted transcriptional regulator